MNDLPAIESWLDRLDPDDSSVDVDDPRDLRDIADALNAVADAVDAARGNGRRWSEIARILGVSRQAAQKRYDRAGAAEAGPGFQPPA